MIFRPNDSLAKRDRTRLRLVNKRSGVSRGGATTQAWRFKTLIGVWILFLGSLFYFFFYSTLFTLTITNLSATQYMPSGDIEKVINNFLQKRRFYIFKQSNYFFLNSDELKKNLEESFLFTEVVVDTERPNNLNITFNEQISLLAVESGNGNSLILMNHFGEQLHTISLSEYNDSLPLLRLLPNDNNKNFNEIKVSEEILKLILQSWKLVNQINAPFKIVLYSSGDSASLDAKTDKDFVIHFAPLNDIDQQIYNLKVITAEFDNNGILPSEYLELRFNEKVYYK